jgi:co-chaperonin GroES (HSP10)
MEAILMEIRPLYDRIVVKRSATQAEETPGRLYIPDTAKEKICEGEVVAAGKGKLLEDGKIVPLDVQAGDRVLFGKHSGSEVKLDGHEYLILREDDVLGILPAQPASRFRQPHDFETIYASTPPWDIGRPQPAFLAMAEQGVFRGRVLDIGCGTGEHALMAASFGLQATGIDTAAAAIAIAEDKARDRGLTARFLVWNALQLASLGEQFDTVLDCGLFHIFDDDERRPFVDNLRTAILPGGRYFMLCFSDRQPGNWGPRRVTQDEIRANFNDGWQVDSIEPARIEITVNPSGIVAWLACITRT